MALFLSERQQIRFLKTQHELALRKAAEKEISAKLLKNKATMDKDVDLPKTSYVVTASARNKQDRKRRLVASSSSSSSSSAKKRSKKKTNRTTNAKSKKKPTKRAPMWTGVTYLEHLTSTTNSSNKRKGLKLNKLNISARGKKTRPHGCGIKSQSYPDSRKPLSIVNKSGYRGVCQKTPGAAYDVSITINKKQVHIGCYDCPKHGAIEYDRAVIKYGLPKLYLNFPKNMCVFAV